MLNSFHGFVEQNSSCDVMVFYMSRSGGWVGKAQQNFSYPPNRLCCFPSQKFGLFYVRHVRYPRLYLPKQGDPNRTHSIKKMPTHSAKQFGLKACNQRHSVLTWRRFPVAAKRKRPIPFNWQLSEAVFPVYVLKLFLSLGLEKKRRSF